MRRIALALTLALTATSALAHGRGLNIRNSADDCSPRNIRFGNDDGFVKKEVIEPGNIRSLKVSVKNAPVSVEGGAASYSIVVCKAAEVASDLDLIRVTLDGNELVGSGPDHDRWTVLYHLNVPRGADLDLSAKNGPLSISNVEGNIVARSHNGPLSLRDIDGTVDAETHNGPISISGGSGTMKVSASNGPLSVDLEGRSWNGTLDASTKNGPLSVNVPNGYGSGVLVEARGRGPIRCRADGCERFWRNHDDDWDEPRRIELGSGPVNVRLSTVNGPVTVKGE
ncbi:MAG TPA: hypothetical protein VF266_28295 [Thermoanaerobaculia bacterium]